jgi:hypothetical protein
VSDPDPNPRCVSPITQEQRCPRAEVRQYSPKTALDTSAPDEISAMASGRDHYPGCTTDVEPVADRDLCGIGRPARAAIVNKLVFGWAKICVPAGSSAGIVCQN